MKDKQIGSVSAEPRIPFVSAVLHCVSMTALVYLRSSFGFGFLRPKSVFFAFSWAFALYAIYAWIDGEAWREHRAVLFFGIGAIMLYWFHFFSAFQREWNQTGEHEHYSGASCLFWLMRRFKQATDRELETRFYLWLEPGAVLFVSIAFRLLLGAQQLSSWLFFAAVCLWSKQALNYWFHIRGQKRQRDNFADTEETVEPLGQTHAGQELPRATRKPKIQRSRSAAAAENTARESAEEHRWAKVLRLQPPYSMEMAEANYCTLIKEEHPDANDGSEESTVRARELNEAIGYFRGISHT